MPETPPPHESVPPRFGRALSKTRSLHQKRLLKQARRFLKQAASTTNCLDERASTNAHWMKHAELAPVMAYLAGGGK